MVEILVAVGVFALALGITLFATRLAAMWLAARRTGWWQVLLALLLAWVVNILATVAVGAGSTLFPAILDLPAPLYLILAVAAVLLPTLLVFAAALGTTLLRALGIGFLSYALSAALVIGITVVLPLVGLGGAVGLDALLSVAREEMAAAGVHVGPAVPSPAEEGRPGASLADLRRSADAVCGCARDRACVTRETRRFVALQAELLNSAASRGDTDAIEKIELTTQRADPCMDRRASRADAPPREVTLEELDAETQMLCECVARHPLGTAPREKCVARFTRPFSLPDDPAVIRRANEAMERAQRCMSGVPEPAEPAPEESQAEALPAVPTPAPRAPAVSAAKQPARALAAAYHWRPVPPRDAPGVLGELVWITDEAGEEYKGLLVEVRPGVLVLKRAVADGGDIKEIPSEGLRGLKVFEKRG